MSSRMTDPRVLRPGEYYHSTVELDRGAWYPEVVIMDETDSYVETAWIWDDSPGFASEREALEYADDIIAELRIDAADAAEEAAARANRGPL